MARKEKEGGFRKKKLDVSRGNEEKEAMWESKLTSGNREKAREISVA